PYVPVALPVILPAKVHLNFGPPMHFDSAEVSEEQVTERVEAVKAEISRLIDKGLSERKRLF
ncbi:MAG: glycerol acyltransferase, partial [Marinobacter sp. 34-60-7]